jgi:hypothetical protein
VSSLVIEGRRLPVFHFVVCCMARPGVVGSVVPPEHQPLIPDTSAANDPQRARRPPERRRDQLFTVAACSRNGYPFAPDQIAPSGFDMIYFRQPMTGKLLFPYAHNPCHTRCSWYPRPRAGARIETAISRCALASEVRVAPRAGPRIETAISRCALASRVRGRPGAGTRIETAISRCALASEVRVGPRASGADWNGFFLKDDQDELVSRPPPQQVNGHRKSVVRAKRYRHCR